MNALTSRDAVFSDLHNAFLKPLGFRKKGHWSVLEELPFIHSVYLRASRWSGKAEATFWIDIQVFHREWYVSLFAPKPFPGPTEGTPSLLTEELGLLCDPPMHTLHINATTNTSALVQSLGRALQDRALPILQQCATLEGVLSYYQSRNNPSQYALSAAVVCLLLGRKEEATRHMQFAKETAPHENALRWLELREKSMNIQGNVV
jgi:hypothetical protein